MPHVIRIDEVGPPDVLKWVDVPAPKPGKGEALIRQTAVGVNYIDVYHRSGAYPMTLPGVPGSEGAGVVEAVGPDVTEVQVGDRVAYLDPIGSYAEVRINPAARLVKIPAGVDEKIAAASLLKGMTAYYLLFRTFKVGRGTILLFHAAAGGVGTLATQWATRLGATVIGTVGTEEKAAVARANGCAQVINYRREDFVARARDLTGGEGVDVVYDSVGRDTFPGSLDALKRLGMWVSFGQSSGLPPPFTAADLQRRGSLFATRPTTAHYFARRSDLVAGAAAMFAAIADGTIRPTVSRTFPLRDAAEAHRALESRQSTGSLVLVP
jgi:NADPH2:quinone reductase